MDTNDLFTKYKTLLPWNLSRLKCFWSLILGILISGNVQQHKCILGFSKNIQPSSHCRRLRDFLKNVEIDFSTLARALVVLSGKEGPLDLILDRTNWAFGKREINLLVLAFKLSETFALPLFWKALPKKGNSNSQERIDLLDTFVKTFGTQKIGSLLADREFVGKPWIDHLIKQKITFLIRIKKNRLVEWDEGMRPIENFFTHLKGRQKRHITFKIQGHPLFFTAVRSQVGELVIIMSNRDYGQKALGLYKNRWSIELMFRHAKTNGFNLEDTHLKDLRRIEKLLGAICFALLLSFLKGGNEEKIKPTPYKKSLKTKEISTFRRGLDALRRILIHDFSHALSFIMSYLWKYNHSQPQKIFR